MTINSLQKVVISVDVADPGPPVSPLLYGVFFEEINRAGDGGLYAEMIQNRSFEDAEAPLGWTLLQEGDAEAQWRLDRQHPLNGENPTSLRIDVQRAGKRVRVVNDGFRGIIRRGDDKSDPNMRESFERRFNAATTGGIAVREGGVYDLTFYARGTKDVGLVTASIENSQGVVLAEGTAGPIGEEWKPYRISLRADATDARAKLVLAVHQPGTIWVDMVSLFPADAVCGLFRPDLFQMIRNLCPAFLRFPGGCYVEGDTLEEAFEWKTSLGDIAARPGHWNLWGYRSTDGLGYHEYLLLSEALGAEPLLVVNAGISHREVRGQGKAPEGAALAQYVQDALDAIEYANGPASSPWGALRTQAGHPEPFCLKYIEIGNESTHEHAPPIYHAHYALFYNAIKARYPEMHVIANDWVDLPRDLPLDIIDVHKYANPQEMALMATKYDTADRRGPKIYFGEYAVTENCGDGNLRAAVAEAAFMTGLERNGDLVVMASYAPLLDRAGWRAWHPNAIVFDSSRAYGTPSYWVQALFTANRGDLVLPVRVECPAPPEPAEDDVPAALYAVAGRQGNTVILKVVNTGREPVTAQIDLRRAQPVSYAGTVIRLTSEDPDDENSFAEPAKVAPKEDRLPRMNGSFPHAFPPCSVTILRLEPQS